MSEPRPGAAGASDVAPGQGEARRHVSQVDGELRIEIGDREYSLAIPVTTREQADIMAERVLFSVEMFDGLARRFSTDMYADFRDGEWIDFPHGSPWWFRGQGILEAFVLKARVLDDFLYQDEKALRRSPGDSWLRKLSDALAIDFVHDPERWYLERPPRDHALMERFFLRANKVVFHLNWRQVKEGEIPDHDPHASVGLWEPWPIYDALRPGLQAFAEHAHADLVGGELKTRLLHALNWKDEVRDARAFEIEREARREAIELWTAWDS
jgi:hypothetical protein